MEAKIKKYFDYLNQHRNNAMTVFAIRLGGGLRARAKKQFHPYAFTTNTHRLLRQLPASQPGFLAMTWI